tara:strand:+ start:6523 stop:7746 length:1224 start_codon:yes stop_codon:yes gene_type:complete
MTQDLTFQEVEENYQELKAKGFKLDLTRGKPSKEQLDLSSGLNDSLVSNYLIDGIDTRNYGEILGLEEARLLGSHLLGCKKEMVIAGGNSSLTLMAQYVSNLFFQGSGEGPWSMQERNSILCPVPGYDRHFKLCEEFAINMVPVALTGKGPDIEQALSMVKDDKSIKGIWCVPKHSNPTGETYDEESVNGLLEIASVREGFRILWDNAYAVHDFSTSKPLPNIFSLAEQKDLVDSVIAFGSTSKITYAGSGISFIAMSQSNLDSFLKHYSSIVIGPDKVNQLRHIEFFKDFNGLKDHMLKHAEILIPKFNLVQEWLSKQNYGSWTRPTGGYFVTYKAEAGLAKEIIRLAKDAGLKLTPAGATFPYGVDPKDEIIRLAPTACTMEELEKAMELFNVCVALATLKKVSS